jgi:hypothetical protein
LVAVKNSRRVRLSQLPCGLVVFNKQFGEKSCAPVRDALTSDFSSAAKIGNFICSANFRAVIFCPAGFGGGGRRIYFPVYFVQ